MKIMKWLLILLVTLPIFSYAQDNMKCLPETEFKQLVKSIDTMLERDSLYQVQIKQYKEQIANFKSLATVDSATKALMTYQIDMYRQQTDIMQVRIDYLEKRQTHWTNNRILWFVLGVGTVYIASEVVNNIK